MSHFWLTIHLEQKFQGKSGARQILNFAMKKKLPIVGYMPYGKGKLIFSTLYLKGFVGVNPVLDRFLKKLL